jgi:hypothetical protein
MRNLPARLLRRAQNYFAPELGALKTSHCDVSVCRKSSAKAGLFALDVV